MSQANKFKMKVEIKHKLKTHLNLKYSILCNFKISTKQVYFKIFVTIIIFLNKYFIEIKLKKINCWSFIQISGTKYLNTANGMFDIFTLTNLT